MLPVSHYERRDERVLGQLSKFGNALGKRPPKYDSNVLVSANEGLSLEGSASDQGVFPGFLSDLEPVEGQASCCP